MKPKSSKDWFTRFYMALPAENLLDEYKYLQEIRDVRVNIAAAVIMERGLHLSERENNFLNF